MDDGVDVDASSREGQQQNCETTTTTDDNERRRRWLAVIVVARQPHPQTASCTGIAMSVPACLLASRDRAQLLLTGLGARRGRRQRE